ncbi:MAG: diguanylate cyclase [Gammaproteobacteria bacterium]
MSYWYDMHRLIKRQIRRIYGSSMKIEQLPLAEQKLIELISATYDENDLERGFLENVIEVNSRELNEKNAVIQRALFDLSESQRMTRTGSWIYEIANDRYEWSDELYRITETDPTQGPLTLEALRDRVHSDDQVHFDSGMHLLREHGSYDGIYRLCCADGNVKYIHEYRVGRFDKITGDLQIVRGTIQDISVLRMAEEELRLYAIVFHHSGEGLAITDSKNRIVAVNSAFTKITGFELIHVQGQLIQDLFVDNNIDSHRWERTTIARSNGYCQREVIGQRADGSQIPLWITVSESWNRDQCIDYYIYSFWDITERKANEERIHHLAHHDNLTGLVNRFSLEVYLKQALERAEKNNEQVALMFIDMDRFKAINDSLGHAAGDQLLIEVASRLKSSVRKSDVVARIGGDEFVVVCSGLKNCQSIIPLAHFLAHRLSMTYVLNGTPTFSSSSIGVSIFPADASDGDGLLKNADTAMYHAKKAGRNNCRLFVQDMKVELQERLDWENSLRYAVENNQFELYFQPIICSHNNRPKAVETLVRWNHPELGLVSPEQFIPIAEETGLILPLGAWVIEEACRQHYLWRTQFQLRITISVNVSARQLRSDQLIDQIQDVINRYGITEGDLVLEITETTAMENPDEAIERLREIRKLNVGLAHLCAVLNMTATTQRFARLP